MRLCPLSPELQQKEEVLQRDETTAVTPSRQAQRRTRLCVVWNDRFEKAVAVSRRRVNAP